MFQINEKFNLFIKHCENYTDYYGNSCLKCKKAYQWYKFKTNKGKLGNGFTFFNVVYLQGEPLLLEEVKQRLWNAPKNEKGIQKVKLNILESKLTISKMQNGNLVTLNVSKFNFDKNKFKVEKIKEVKEIKSKPEKVIVKKVKVTKIENVKEEIIINDVEELPIVFEDIDLVEEIIENIVPEIDLKSEVESNRGRFFHSIDTLMDTFEFDLAKNDLNDDVWCVFTNKETYEALKHLNDISQKHIIINGIGKIEKNFIAKYQLAHDKDLGYFINIIKEGK